MRRRSSSIRDLTRQVAWCAKRWKSRRNARWLSAAMRVALGFRIESSGAPIGGTAFVDPRNPPSRQPDCPRHADGTASEVSEELLGAVVAFVRALAVPDRVKQERHPTFLHD